MKIKGRTTIELYDENNNVIYTQKKNNLVTGAIYNLFKQNYAPGLSGNFEGTASLTPIWKNFGGLQLFENRVNESEIIPWKDSMTGFTGNATDPSHFDSTNPYNGHFVANDSILGNDYCKLVFDFPVGSVAGQIAAVGLTSITGGNAALSSGTESVFAGYGTGESLGGVSRCSLGNLASDNSRVPGSACFIPFVKTSEGRIAGITRGGNLIIVSNSSNVVTFKMYKQSYKIGLTDRYEKVETLAQYESIYGGVVENYPFLEKIDEKTITFPHNPALQNTTIDEEYVYLVESGSSQTGGTDHAVLGRVHFGDDGFSETPEIMTVHGAHTDGTVRNVKTDGKKLYVNTDTSFYFGNLPTWTSGTQEIVLDRIEIPETNLTPFTFMDTCALINRSNITANATRNIYFLTNTNVLNKCIVKFDSNTNASTIHGFCFNFNQPVFGIICQTNGGFHTINCNVFTPYFATINNINPITKYATTGMRVVYELYTEDYNK